MNPYDDEEDTVDELPAVPRRDIPAADRELLELAARALGAVRVEDTDGEDWLRLHFADGSAIQAWNPLAFGGDAFELAAALELDVMHRVVGGKRIEVLAAGGPLIQEFYQGDATPAARRAITRAAAEIGAKVSQRASERAAAPAPPAPGK